MTSPKSILLKGGTVLLHDDNDEVQSILNTDILIEDTLISKIGPKLTAPPDAQVIDCSSKIISPGFISTHNHLWQSALKGIHTEDTLFDYMPKGNFAAYIYTPEDTFIGQLAGCLEQIDVGTTTALDHAHGTYTLDHMKQALKGTVASGLRTIYAHAETQRFSKWNEDEIEPSMEQFAEDRMSYLADQATRLNDPKLGSRVTIGMGFDAWYLPPEMIKGLFQRMVSAGVNTVTTHNARHALMGFNKAVLNYKSLGVLDMPSYYVISHGTNMSDEETAVVKASAPRVSVSVTPETEHQMCMHGGCAFDRRFDKSQLTLGVDCLSNNTSYLPVLGRTTLYAGRSVANELQYRANGKALTKLPGSTLEVFNMMTVNGGRTLGLKTGALKEGYKADLVLFDTRGPGIATAATYDPLVAVMRFSDVRDVDTVIVDGIIRKQAGKLLPVEVDGKKLSWDEVREFLVKSQRDLQPRWNALNMDKARQLMVNMYGIDISNFVEPPI